MSLKVLIFLLVYASLLFGSVLWHPVMAIWAYMLSYIGISRASWWGQDLLNLPIRYAMMASLFIVSGYFLHRSKLLIAHRVLNRREKYIGVFWLILILSFAFADIRPDDTQFVFIKMMKLGVFLYFFSRIISDLKTFQWTIKILCVLGLLLGINAFAAPDWMFATGRLNALGNADFANANTLAALLGFLLCLSGFQFFQKGPLYQKILWTLCIIFICNGIILCRSRGVFLAVICAALGVVFFGPMSQRHIKKKVFQGMLLGGCLFLFLADTSFIERVTDFDRYGEDKSSVGRLEIWAASIPLIMDHPFGIGIGNFKEYIGDYDASVVFRDSHNTIIRCYSELGVHGLFIFLICYGTSFFQLGRIQKKTKGSANETEINLYCISIYASLILTFVAGLFSTILYIEFFWWVMVLPICLEKVVDREIFLSISK